MLLSSDEHAVFVLLSSALSGGGVYRPYKDKDAIGSTREVLLAGFEGEPPATGLEIHVAEEDLKDLPSAEMLEFRFLHLGESTQRNGHLGNTISKISRKHPKN